MNFFRLLLVDECLHAFLGRFLQLDTEEYQHEEAYAAGYGIDRAAHRQCVIDAVRHDGHDEHLRCVLRRTLHEVVDRVTITHDDCERIMTGNSEQRTHRRYREPSFAALQHVRYVLDGGKTQTDAYRIDDAVEMLIEIGVSAKHQPKD